MVPVGSFLCCVVRGGTRYDTSPGYGTRGRFSGFLSSSSGGFSWFLVSFFSFLPSLVCLPVLDMETGLWPTVVVVGGAPPQHPSDQVRVVVLCKYSCVP